MKKTVNVGCGNKTFLEYPKGHACLNVDCRDLPNVDIVADIRKLGISDDAVDYILASDVIEHFPIAETVDVLTEWCRILKVGGVIEFRLPNIAAICKHYVETNNAKYVSWLLYGGQDYPTNYHYVGFDKEWFTSVCKEVGLTLKDYKEDGFNMIIKMEKTNA